MRNNTALSPKYELLLKFPVSSLSDSYFLIDFQSSIRIDMQTRKQVNKVVVKVLAYTLESVNNQCKYLFSNIFSTIVFYYFPYTL